jgi:hypothetical protein
MNHDAMIAVIAAHKEGKPIQYKINKLERIGKWYDIPNPSWDFNQYTYRVAHELIEGWVNVYSDGSMGTVHKSLPEASFIKPVRVVKVREVVE